MHESVKAREIEAKIREKAELKGLKKINKVVIKIGKGEGESREDIGVGHGIPLDIRGEDSWTRTRSSMAEGWEKGAEFAFPIKETMQDIGPSQSWRLQWS